MTHTIRMLTRMSLPLLLVFAAGCQDSTGPDSLQRLDAEAVLADYEAMDSVLASRAWASFLIAADGMDAAALGAAPAAAVQATAELKSLSSGDARSFASAMTDIASAGSLSAARLPLISAENRGKTFVYDADNDRWVIDPALTDAPATGVRFIIYEPSGAEPDPTQPIGHADLIDLGDDFDGIALRLLVVAGDLTVVDYETTLTGADGSGRITVDGFLQNTRDRLDFEIDVDDPNGVITRIVVETSLPGKAGHDRTVQFTIDDGKPAAGLGMKAIKVVDVDQTLAAECRAIARATCSRERATTASPKVTAPPPTEPGP